MADCPCCSTHNYKKCCGLYLDNAQLPATPEALMRSRYTAYSLANIEYIKKTMRGKPLNGFDEVEAKHWAQSSVWIGLRVVNTSLTQENSGFVEFIAQFMEGDKIKSIHEKSEFHYDQGAWFYVDGIRQPTKDIPVSRNTPCPCGSQKKFKNCHQR